MANTYEEKLGTEKMLPLILKMALPSVAAQLVNLLYSIVDRIYIGHIPEIGTDALAGIGVTSSVIMLVAAFANIVGGGGAPLASIALGKGDRERAKRILGNGFGLLVIFAAVTSAAVYIFMEPLLLLTGASEATIGYSMDYLSVYMTGTLFVMLATGLNTFINAQGRPGIGMLSVIIGALLNVVLDPLFIYTAAEVRRLQPSFLRRSARRGWLDSSPRPKRRSGSKNDICALTEALSGRYLLLAPHHSSWQARKALSASF